MMERKGLEASRYLGGDFMISILICDDDITIVEEMHLVIERILRDADRKAKIYTFTDAASVSEQILSGCDIALLDIDFDGAEYNGMDIARKFDFLFSILEFHMRQLLSFHRFFGVRLLYHIFFIPTRGGRVFIYSDT